MKFSRDDAGSFYGAEEALPMIEDLTEEYRSRKDFLASAMGEDPESIEYVKTFWQEVYQPADGMISSREAHREIMKEDFIMRELNARRQIGMLLVETESFLIFLTWIKEFFRHIDPEAYMQFEQKRKH